MKYEVFFNGSVCVEADDEESAISQATEYINENSKHYCEVKEVEDEEEFNLTQE